MVVISSKPENLKTIFKEIFQFRYLLKRLVLRDIKVRYNNTTLGILWNIIQPLAMMCIFVLFLGLLFRGQTSDIPLPIYTYSALCLWHFFSKSISQGGMSFVQYHSLLSKIYFPRILAPLSLVIGAAVDFIVAYGLLIVLEIFYGCFSLKQVLFTPIIFIGLFVFSFSLALLFSVISAKFKDFTHIIPVVMQLWVFCCPIMYPYAIVPEKYLWIYNLNPIVGYVEVFRWTISQTIPMPSLSCILPSIIITIITLVLSIHVYKICNKTIIDEI